jgi:folate-binding protein YgfZ
MMRVADLTAVRRRWWVRGADRVAFLHGQCTNDIRRLRPGEHCYAAFLTPKGKMRGDADVVCLEEAFLLSSLAELPATLEKYVITEDVTIERCDLTEHAVWGEKPTGVAVYDNRLGGWNVIGGQPVGEPVSWEEMEQMRIAAGVPLWGVDMDENTIPVEAGLAAWAISYEKGCYIGQETIARIKTYGHVNRRLVQVRLGGKLALRYVRRELAKPGAVVTVDGIPAEVIQLCGS